MRKIMVLFIMAIVSLSHARGQTISGEWGFCINNSITNNHGFKAGKKSSIKVNISLNGTSHTLVDENLKGLSSGHSTNRDSDIKTYQLTQRVLNFSVYTKLDKSGGSDPDNGWKDNIALQTRNENIGYKKYTYTNSQVYWSFHGIMDIYVFPKNLKIGYKSGSSQILPTLDKIQLEAPSGYTSDTYRWVYSSDNGSTWHQIANSSLQGNRLVNISGEDIYGSNYESKMTIGANTWVALEYYIYKDRDNPKVAQRSNVLSLSNQKSAPRILSVTATGKICFGTANGKLKVQLDRALLPGERLLVDYKNLASSAIGNISDPVLDSDNSFFLENKDAGSYQIQVSGFYNGVATYSDGADHKKIGKIESFPALTYSTTTKADITCYGENNGRITVTASGGDGTYQLYWRKQGGAYLTTAFTSSNQTSLSNLEPGTYEYYVTDTHDCELRDQSANIVTRTETFLQPDKALDFAFQNLTEPSGYGRSDGSAVLTGDGGTPLPGNTYTVTWKNKQTGQVVAAVENDPSGAKFRTTAKNIPAGTYTVAIKDKNNCVFTDEITLGQPKELVVMIQKTHPILCYGDTNGELVAHAEGGVTDVGQGYTYQWYKKNGGTYQAIAVTDSVASNLGQGDYKIEVKDKSRIANVVEKEFSLTQPSILSTSVTKQYVTCFGGNNGLIRIEVFGGAGGYKLHYKLKDDAAYAQPLDPQGNVFTLDNLTTNEYWIYITDANGCYAPIEGADVAQITISQPSQALEISHAAVKPVSGFGRSDGSITVKIKGGTPHPANPLYTVIWKNASGTTVASSEAIGTDNVFTSKIENLPENVYTVEIRDKNYAGLSNACYVTASFTIIQPEAMTLQLENANGVYCHGEETGALTAHVTGGVSGSFSGMPYNYKWYEITNGNATVISNQNDSILSNRRAGRYKVKVEDASNPPNTIESAVFEITQPALLATIATTRNVGCYGENTGFIHINVSGGTGSYTLFCKKEGTDSDYREYPINTGDNTFYLDNLYSGKYSVYLLDGNNCYAGINGNPIHEFILTQPAAPLTITESAQTDVSGYGRSDGEITIKVAGGTINAAAPYYSIIWKNTGGTVFTGIDAFDSFGVFTSKIQNLPKGTYTVEIRDNNYGGTANTCYATATFSLTQPDPLTVQLLQTDSIYCHGEATGTLVAYAKGGVPNHQAVYPYTYKWYKIENGNAIIIPNETDSVLVQRSAGHYKVRIEDFSRIANTVESAVSEITQPALLVTVLSTRNSSCHALNDGFIRVKVSGGVGGYRLFCKKDSDAGYREHAIESDNTTFLINNLYSGTYSLYIQDANGCYAQINSQDIHEVTLTQPAAPLVISAMAKTDASGYGRSDGDIKITIEGGTPYPDNTYDLIWKNEAGQTLSATGLFENGKYVSLLNNIPKGSYQVEIKDRNYAGAYPTANSSCIVQELYSISEPDELLAEVEETHFISCNGMSDGQLTVHATGGIRNPVAGRLPYIYKWYKEEPGTGYTLLANERDSVLLHKSAGNYKVEIEDYSRVANTLSVDYKLQQPQLLQATATDTEITCGQTARIAVTVTGGTAPYSYQWSTGDKTASVNNMTPGRYFVFVTDSRGCETTAVAKVSTPADLQVTAVKTNPVCYGANNGSIKLQVTGGTAPYTYQWTNGAATQELDNIQAGLYTVLVTDKDGCTYTDNIVLSDPEPLTVYLGEDRTLCKGQSLTLAPLVTDPKTKFHWTGPDSFKAVSSEITVAKAGTYRLTISDSKGCQATDEINISLKDVDISSEILVATEVFAGDTIVIVNISNPNPDRVEWLLDDTDSLKVVEWDGHYAKVLFSEKGYYKIGLRAHQGDCFQEIFKTITVLDKNDTGDDSFGESIIEKYQIYPNPNHGNFQVKVTLNKTSAIRLRIIHVGTGNTVSDKKYAGEKEYDIPYRISLTSGVYIIVLETASGYMNLKMIIG
ncbi:MAG: T9SS type A sorting domain-containing protein [Dysgonamonadaceae bacterium]